MLRVVLSIEEKGCRRTTMASSEGESKWPNRSARGTSPVGAEPRCILAILGAPRMPNRAQFYPGGGMFFARHRADHAGILSLN